MLINPSTVTRTASDAYSVRSAGLFATICVREWARPTTHSGARAAAGGELMVNSSELCFAGIWDGLAVGFREYLVTTPMDAIAEQCRGMQTHAYDATQTLSELRRLILRLRRDRRISRRTALAAEAGVLAYRSILSASPDAIAPVLARLAVDVGADLLDLAGVPAEALIHMGPRPAAQRFTQLLWAPFTAYLRDEIAAAAQSEELDAYRPRP